MSAVITGGVRKVGIVAPNRIVRACNRSTGELVEETISDQIGNYTFQNLNTSITYYIYALDEAFNQYNAAIGDVLKSRPLFSFTGTATGTLESVSSSAGIFNLSSIISVGSVISTGVSTTTINTTTVSTGGLSFTSSSIVTIDIIANSAGMVEHPIFDVTGTASGALDVVGNYNNISEFTYTMGIGEVV